MHPLDRRVVRRALDLVATPVVVLLTLGVLQASAQSPLETFPVWPGQPPGETATLPPEADTSTADSDKVAGRTVIRLGNVSTPTLTVHPAPAGIATGAAVVVCPGGGHRILAMDLEGSEVAAWLNAQGVTAFVLKYRVPAREPGPRWRVAVDDAQRAMSLVRSRAASFGVDPSRIGILGFSAGGETAGLTALLPERQYAPVDAVDQVPYRPDFVILAYAAGMATQDGTGLREYVRVTKDTPPMFLVHAQDDFVPVQNSVLLFLALKAAGVPSELHVYAAGGHGYGLRETDSPVTTWHHRAAAWMKASGWLTRRSQ